MKKQYDLNKAQLNNMFHEKKGYDRFAIGGLQVDITKAYEIIRKKSILPLYSMEISQAMVRFADMFITEEYAGNADYSNPIVCCKFDIVNETFLEDQASTNILQNCLWPIDGWKRLFRAIKAGETTIKCICLSPADSRRVILYEGSTFLKPSARQT